MATTTPSRLPLILDLDKGTVMHYILYIGGTWYLAPSNTRHSGRPQLNLSGPQSRSGDKLLRVRLVCPQNGTAVLKGSRNISLRKIDSNRHGQ